MNTRLILGICAGLVLLTAFIFLQTLHHSFIAYDTEVYVTKNVMIRKGISWESFLWAFTTMRTGDWQPLVWISFMLDYELFGLNPGGYHFTNVVLHALNTVFAFIAIWLLTGRIWPAAFVAAFFGVHPLRVESVAWIAERKDVLSGLFWWLSIGAYALSKLKSKAHFFYLSFFFFFLGILSKPIIVSLPLVLLLLDYWPLGSIHSFDSFKRSILNKLPFFALSVFSCFMTIKAIGSSLISLQKLPLLNRILNAALSYVLYIKKTLWPFDLAIFYPYPNPFPVIPAGLSLLILFAIFWLVWKQKIQKPYLVTGWLWYLITLFPVIGIVQGGEQSMADRYSYLPHAGLGIMVVLFFAGFPKPSLKWVSAAGSLAIVFFAIASFRTTQLWNSSLTLNEHAAKVVPNNYVAYNNLGYYYYKREQPDKAAQYHELSLKIRPNDSSTISQLGNVYLFKHNFAEAEKLFKRALSINPKNIPANNSLALMYLWRGDHKRAEYHFLQVLQKRKRQRLAKNGLAEIYIRQNRYAEAEKLLSEVLHLDPRNSYAHFLMGRINEQEKDLDNALKHYEKAISGNLKLPRAMNQLAILLMRKGDLLRSEKLLREMVALEPSLLEGYLNLSAVLIEARRADEAKTVLQQALKIKPGSKRVDQILKYIKTLPKHKSPDSSANTRPSTLDHLPVDQNLLVEMNARNTSPV